MSKAKDKEAAVVETPIVETPVVVVLEEQTVEPKKGNVVPAAWRAKVGKAGSVGDPLALALKAVLAESKDVRATLVEIGQQNGVDVLARWGDRNVGMVRMNLGNVLRGLNRKGEVRIGETVLAKVEEAKAE